MKRPVIGVVPLWDSGKNSVWMLPGYLDGITLAGGLPVILPFTDTEDIIASLALRFDGFLFTGGQDVSPSLYGETVKPACGEVCELRDRMESMLLREALKNDRPLLGICRGIQFLNAALGGTLYQDIPSELPSDLIHAQKPPYDLPSHNVKVWGKLSGILGANELAVNSYHHQGIKTLSSQLDACAEADDGLIEAVHIPNERFVWAVQWHPELSLKAEHSAKLFAAFIRACSNG
jgi:putative glutamine amidotransferase